MDYIRGAAHAYQGSIQDFLLGVEFIVDEEYEFPRVGLGACPTPGKFFEINIRQDAI